MREEEAAKFAAADAGQLPGSLCNLWEDSFFWRALEPDVDSVNCLLEEYISRGTLEYINFTLLKLGCVTAPTHSGAWDRKGHVMHSVLKHRDEHSVDPVCKSSSSCKIRGHDC